MASAQSYRHRWTATTTPLDSGSTPETQQRIQGYRQSNNFQTQIAALGSTPVASLPMPALFGVSPSDLSPNFGDPRTNHPHMGEDIMAVKGTPIVSPTAAVVLRLEQGATEGNGIYTVNPGGETFVYYHLDRYAEGIAAGQVLEPGSLIGYVGNTGDAAGGAAHIHFEIHDSSGTPIDPFPRLTGEFTLQEKITYLSKILTQTTDSVALSRFLVTNFRATFLNALAANISLPMSIIEALASLPASAAPTGAGGALPPGDLDIGSSGAAVVALQTYLIQAASGVAGARLAGAGATGSFGIITKAALVEYQVSVGISPASGYYGPVTRAFIAAHPLGAPGASGTPSPVASGNSVNLSRDLFEGMSGDDVRALQQTLNANGYMVASTGNGSSGNETIYFGPATKAAVIRFQIARGISPSVGYVGPITRAVLASL
jgi:peptidoglycan hydrolase-like protein with peptidoglycan-binding domain